MDLEELQDILSCGEGQYIEFKADFPKQAHDIAKEMVALANSGGGTLLMGVNDDGIPIGIEDPLKVDERLAGISRDCNPSLWIKIFRISLSSDVNVVCAKIPAIICTTYKGKVYIRNGSTSIESGGKDIENLITRKLNSQDIVLEVDIESIERISKHDLQNKAWRGLYITAIGLTICIPIMIFTYLNGNNIILQIIGILALVTVTYYFFFHFPKPYFREMNLYSNRPRGTDTVMFIGDGKLMEDGGTEYLIYTRTAPCIKSNCHEKHGGMIAIVDAPPREVSRIRKSFVGKCSVGGEDHSYFIDNIWNATPAKFDWRTPDKT
jgi:Putative DNA-binding domain